MILFVTDTHCHFEIINKQIEYAEELLKSEISSVIHLGDFGIYKSQLHEFFIKKRNRFKRTLYLIDGNHEDFNAFPKLVEKYSEFFTYLPRASVNTIDGYRFLSLGGTGYMDSANTQRSALITDKQIDACLAIPSGDVDIIITHDCPSDIGVPNTPGLEYFGKTGFNRSNELSEYFKPKLWLFGHHHKWFNYKDDRTEYYGINGIWKGFGLLDNNFNFIMMKHKIEWEKSPLIDRILMKLKIMSPDAPIN